MPAQQQSHHDPPDDNNTYDHGNVSSRRGSAAPRNKNVYTYTQDGMHRLADSSLSSLVAVPKIQTNKSPVTLSTDYVRP